MGRVWIATVANFFLPGLGNLILGDRVPSAVLWLVGVIGLTYVEQSVGALDAGLYWTMFAAVLVMNTGFAIDAWRAGVARLAAA